MSRKLCGIQGCNFPEGECAELCWHPEDRRMDVIGQNGNDGLHYQNKGRVHVVVIEDGKVTMDYMSNWITGNGVEQLERAKVMLDIALRAKK